MCKYIDVFLDLKIGLFISDPKFLLEVEIDQVFAKYQKDHKHRNEVKSLN